MALVATVSSQVDTACSIFHARFVGIGHRGLIDFCKVVFLELLEVIANDTKAQDVLYGVVSGRHAADTLPMEERGMNTHPIHFHQYQLVVVLQINDMPLANYVSHSLDNVVSLYGVIVADRRAYCKLPPICQSSVSYSRPSHETYLVDRCCFVMKDRG